ncbi:MAG: outer membrane lipoprotein carrier protein LolA [Terrimicrobiaceae bacterium]
MKPAALTLALCLGFRAFAVAEEVPARVAERLRQLESKLSTVQTLKVDFVQEKHLEILERKLVLKGRITLQKPDKIAWRVQSPIRYGLVIQGATLRQWSEDTQGIQQFSLAGNPVFSAAVKQLQSWFSGNYLVLAREFDVAVPSGSPLVLEFTPRAGSPSREVIRRIVMRFGEDERFLDRLEVAETGGDTMSITFSDPSLNPPLAKEEWDPRHE